jgi:surfeit locus 1 family protein
LQPDERRRTARPGWVPTVAALATVVLCVAAGNWQHRRMLEKEAVQERMRQSASIAPVPLPAAVDDWSAWRFRQVTATGEYDARHQILIDNKVQAGHVGFDVVTPLRLADGRTVLVDRGWIGAGRSRAMLPQAPPPAGTVTVSGRIGVPRRNYFELGTASVPAGVLWQHLDPARFTRATGIDVPPIVVEATDAASSAGLVADFRVPDAGVDTHLGYMVQWYTFAAMAAGLWGWFTLRPRFRARTHASR